MFETFPEPLLEEGVRFKVIEFSLLRSVESAILPSALTPRCVQEIEVIHANASVAIMDGSLSDYLCSILKRPPTILTLRYQRSFNRLLRSFPVAVSDRQLQDRKFQKVDDEAH